MYDHEITRYIEERNGYLSNLEYIYVWETSPQIDHIKYDAWSNKYEMWSENGTYWSFRVYKE